MPKFKVHANWIVEATFLVEAENGNEARDKVRMGDGPTLPMEPPKYVADTIVVHSVTEDE